MHGTPRMPEPREQRTGADRRSTARPSGRASNDTTRIVVAAVTPAVDGGRFPAKRVLRRPLRGRRRRLPRGARPAARPRALPRPRRRHVAHRAADPRRRRPIAGPARSSSTRSAHGATRSRRGPTSSPRGSRGSRSASRRSSPRSPSSCSRARGRCSAPRGVRRSARRGGELDAITALLGDADQALEARVAVASGRRAARR